MRFARRLPTVLTLACVLCGLAAVMPGQTQDMRGRLELSVSGQRKITLYEASHALLIGVGKYQHWPSLSSVAKELDEVESVLKEQGFTVHIVLDPDDKQLKQAFEDFVGEYGYTPGNRLLFYFAGHGHSFPDKAEGYLVPKNAPIPEQDRTGFLRMAFPMTDVLAWARKMEAKHALFLFDSCFSGTVFQARNLPPPPRYITQATVEPVRQFITAGSANETVPARSDFAPELVKALRYRQADSNQDGYVTGLELGNYLAGTVAKYGKQTPQYGKIADPRLNLGDFVFEVGKDTSLVVAPPPAPVAEPTRGAEPPLRTAKLSVRSNVSGDSVYIDGEAHGATPVNVEVEQRLHLVRVEKEGYKPFEQWLELTGPSTVRARLEPGPVETPVATPLETPEPPIDNTAASGVVPSRHKQVFRDCADCPEMVYLQGGSFQMGGNDRGDNEKPAHLVTLSPFAIGKYEVTKGEFAAFVKAAGYKTKAEQGDGCYGWTGSGWERKKEFTWKNMGFTQDDQHPVACVLRNDAVAYTEWLSKKTGKEYRLPSEAEWEYAARAESTTAYWWGDEASHEYANYGKEECCAGLAEGKDQWEYTSPVGSFQANAFGLHDTAGNVWEWVRDWYGENYYSESPQDNPSGPGTGSDRVVRGGGWIDTPSAVRSASRSGSDPADRNGILGFRLARHVP